MNRNYVTALVWFAGILWVISLYSQGHDVLKAGIGTIPNVLGIVFPAIALIERWGWKWKLLRPWFIDRPILDGTWKIDLDSLWIDPATNLPKKDIEAYLVARQSLFSLSLVLITEQSSSRSVFAEISSADDGGHRVVSVYRNEPLMAHRDHSPIHYGAMRIELAARNSTGPIEDPTSRMEILQAEYWTERQTKGTLRLLGRSAKHHSTFESAREDQYLLDAARPGGTSGPGT